MDIHQIDWFHMIRGKYWWDVSEGGRFGSALSTKTFLKDQEMTLVESLLSEFCMWNILAFVIFCPAYVRIRENLFACIWYNPRSFSSDLEIFKFVFTKTVKYLYVANMYM